ncbi:integrin beta-1-like [Siniperca chuatsi]|uniref:integrin beta-1-like n=1 Tax=Siniperca chuatsi TaxID=119488 RepID=UPI001CE20F2D|nr:integrin beta-1-like [Siniperca chuatsi]
MFVSTQLNHSQYNATGTQDHSDHECQSQGVRSCGECLAAGPHCAWCAEETCVKNFLEVGQHAWERCDTARALQRRGCPFDRLENPRGSTVLLKNQKITSHPKEQKPIASTGRSRNSSLRLSCCTSVQCLSITLCVCVCV